MYYNLRKRKADVLSSKITKISHNEILSKDYMCATDSKYIILNDPVQLAYKIYNINSIDDFINYHLCNFLDKTNLKNKSYQSDKLKNIDLFKNGIDYEKEIISDIIDKIKIGNYRYKQITYDEPLDYRSRLKYNETLNLIKEDYDVIFSGLLVCDKKKIFGIPDIIIKKKLLNELYTVNFPNSVNSLSNEYCIVDIKYSNLILCSDGLTIRNTNTAKAYKAQISVYNYLLNVNLNINNSVSFIICKSEINSELKHKLVLIDYDNNDILYKYENQKYDLVYKYFSNKRRKLVPNNIIKLLKNNLNINDKVVPSKLNKYHYPNMKCTILSSTDKIKRYHANLLKEITLLWGLDYKTRELLHKNNIYTWCKITDAEVDKYVSENKNMIVKNIININRSDEKINWDLPDKLSILNDYLNNDDYHNLYIDFETITDSKYSNEIFMIGIYMSNTYINFTRNDISDNINLLDDFVNFLNTLDKSKKIRLYYWSSFEKSLMDKKGNINLDIIYIDLLLLFRDPLYPITIKGAYNYSLKSIANALYDNKLLNKIWNTESTNGLEAMNMAVEYYKTGEENLIKDIYEYNKIDCKIMYDIICCLKKYFTPKD